MKRCGYGDGDGDGVGVEGTRRPPAGTGPFDSSSDGPSDPKKPRLARAAWGYILYIYSLLYYWFFIQVTFCTYDKRVTYKFHKNMRAKSCLDGWVVEVVVLSVYQGLNPRFDSAYLIYEDFH